MTREEKLAKKRAYNKVYYSDNRNELVEKKRIYRKENREKVNRFQRQYVSRHKDLVRQKKKEYYLKNRDKIVSRRKKNAKQTRETMKRYRILNSDKIREYNKRHYKDSIQYRIAHTLRARIRDAVKRCHRSVRTKELLGISFVDYKKYLESLFKIGMSWDNYGKWEIDHIKPVSSFDLTNKSEQLKAFHYTNTQPLWLNENRVKSFKFLIK